VKVSIIIPAYNAEKTIADTLDSVLSQTHQDWETIVVDDGSTDATAEITRGFAERDARIRMIQQANGGESAARNSGIALAHYDWLLFLDADDWISPLYLERMATALISDPALDAVHCRFARVARDGTHVIEKYVPPVGDMFSTLARRATFPPHACIVRKKLVEEVGNFDTSLRTSPDWDLWQRIARTGARFGAVGEVLAFYRMSPNSASLNAHQLFKDGVRVLKQGHSPDPRVKNPHPDHANGLENEQIQAQEFYLLSWCAGLLLGRGDDARPLLEMVKGDNNPELYPDTVAQCIFESAILPKCQPPQAWEELLQGIQQHLDEFLVALEAQSLAPDLAHRTRIELKKLILKHSPIWNAVIEDYEQRITQFEQRITIYEERIAQMEEQRKSWQRLAEERESIIMKLHEELWVRLALRLGILKSPWIDEGAKKNDASK
jgi:glycosyltransferase involved in cell wall biosynthesis